MASAQPWPTCSVSFPSSSTGRASSCRSAGTAVPVANNGTPSMVISAARTATSTSTWSMSRLWQASTNDACRAHPMEITSSGWMWLRICDLGKSAVTAACSLGVLIAPPQRITWIIYKVIAFLPVLSITLYKPYQCWRRASSTDLRRVVWTMAVHWQTYSRISLGSPSDSSHTNCHRMSPDFPCKLERTALSTALAYNPRHDSTV